MVADRTGKVVLFLVLAASDFETCAVVPTKVLAFHETVIIKIALPFVADLALNHHAILGLATKAVRRRLDRC